MKFIFTCGGTAGHINPALAVASRLIEEVPGSEVLFIGAEGKMEMSLVPEEGYNIVPINITNVSRSISLSGIKHNLKTLSNVYQSKKKAEQIISDFKPDAVIGTGGYVCYPVIMAAVKLGIPTFIHESNAGPGLTTRLLAKHVDRVMVGVEGCANEYPHPENVVVTGTPVRENFSYNTKESARRELGIADDKPFVLSVWGSLGSGYMNNMMLKMIPLLCEKESSDFIFYHATGSMYYDGFMDSLKENCPDYKVNDIEVSEYIHDMSRLMTACDLVLCRAGASTLSELCFLGKPAILIPSPNVTNNHQEKNARILENNDGAKVMLEGAFDEHVLLNTINELITDKEKLSDMSCNMKKMSHDDAAIQIANVILEIVRK